MKEIILTNSDDKAMVDDGDFEFLNRFLWRKNSTGYALATQLRMHRLVLGISSTEIHVDHTNGNRLDNRKSNLRIATPSQNQQNANIRVDNTTGFKGVSKRYGRFVARISVDGKRIHLGEFDTGEEAAIAYDRAAKIHFGEFARINCIDR